MGTLKLRNFIVDFSASHVLTPDGAKNVEPMVLDVLHVLASSTGEVVSRDEIIEKVWGHKPGGDERLTRAISLLRKVFGDVKGRHGIIQTVPKRGYRLDPELFDDPRENTTPVEGLNPHEKSIAILALDDLNLNGGDHRLAESIAEEIINALTRVDGLKVTGRTSSFAAKNRNNDHREMARALNVKYLLDGSIRETDNYIRLTVHLIDGRTGYQIWSETYDRLIGGLFHLQEEVTQSIVTELSKTFSLTAPATLITPPTTNFEAYSLFTQGRQVAHHLNGQRTVPAGIEMLKKAVELDEDFAEAWAWLALAHYILPEFSYTHDWENHLTLARHAAKRALDVDPKLAMGHLVRAMILTNDLKFAAAAQSFELALSLEPKNVETMAGFGLVMMALGKPDIAQNYLDKVIENDPLCGIWHTTLGGIYMMHGDYEKAEECHQIAFDLGFGTGGLGVTYCLTQQGRTDDAIAYINQNIEGLAPVEYRLLRSPVSRYFANNAYIRRQKLSRNFVRIAMRRQLKNRRIQPTAAQVVGLLYINDYDGFIRHVLQKPNSYVAFTIARIWEPNDDSTNFRSHPNFSSFLDRLDIPRAWEQFGRPNQNS